MNSAQASDACALGRDSSSGDRKSTRLNSSHSQISYAVFCLKKKRRYEAETRRDLTLSRNRIFQTTGPPHHTFVSSLKTRVTAPEFVTPRLDCAMLLYVCWLSRLAFTARP